MFIQKYLYAKLPVNEASVLASLQTGFWPEAECKGGTPQRPTQCFIVPHESICPFHVNSEFFYSTTYCGARRYIHSNKHTGIHRAALLSAHRPVNSLLPFSYDTAKQQWKFSEEKCFPEQAI